MVLGTDGDSSKGACVVGVEYDADVFRTRTAGCVDGGRFGVIGGNGGARFGVISGVDDGIINLNLNLDLSLSSTTKCIIIVVVIVVDPISSR